MSTLKTTNIAHPSSASNNIVLDSSGRALVGLSSANSNGGILQLSSGITFPATQVLSTDPNTLDDYEEGTFTPVITTARVVSGTFAATSRYTKIGNTVTILIQQTSGTLTWTAGDQLFSSSGAPFTPVTTTPVVFTDTSPYAGGAGHLDTSGRIYSGTAGTTITTLRISSTYLI